MYNNRNIFLLNKYIIQKNNLFSEDILKNINCLNNEIYNTLKNKKKIFICGNGGSAAISEHVACDLIKNFKFKGKKLIISLTSNSALTTMISNDFGYDKIFSYQLDQFASNKDLLIIISSSGDSENVFKAFIKAKKLNMKIFSLVGFNGGRIKKKMKSNIIHIKSQDYGIIEDCHQSIFHAIISLSHQKP